MTELLKAFSPEGRPITGTLETIPGEAYIKGFDPVSKDPVYAGETDVWWDAQETITDILDEPLYLDDLGTTWPYSTLTFAPADAENNQ
jgi:hypothetical protein